MAFTSAEMALENINALSEHAVPERLLSFLEANLRASPACVEKVSGDDDRECSEKPRDLCESLELSIVQIGLETAEIRVRKRVLCPARS